MKKINILIILALVLMPFTSFAQISTTLIVSPTPPANLTNWAVKKQTVVFIVSSSDLIEGEYKIKTEIQLSDGTVVGKTDLTKSRNYHFEMGNTIYYAEDVVPMENMIFSGKYRSSLNKSGKLPSDNYQMCVSLVGAADFVPMSNVTCKSFYLSATQLPILTKPHADEVLNPVQFETAITFRWTPLVPTPQFVPIYKVLVFEVLQDQTPMQALRSNIPILDQEVRGTTQYIWTPQGILNLNASNNEGNIHPKKLIWTVQTFDSLGEPILEGNNTGDGVAEPVLFYVGLKKVAEMKLIVTEGEIETK